MSSKLAADEPRPAFSDAERIAASEVAEELHALGRSATVEQFWARPHWWLVQAVCSAVGVLASVLCIGSPMPGLIVAAAALLLALSDSTRVAPLRRLTTARASQNVISPPAAVTPKPAVTLILTAAIDDRLKAPSRVVPSSLIATNAACIALVAACAALRLASIDAMPVAIAQLIPTMLLLGAILVFLDRGRAQAVRDGSAVEAALEIAALLDADPPENLRVAVVLAGAGSSQAAGLRKWLRSLRSRGVRPVDVAILDVECCSSGAATWWERDGTVIATGLHPQLRRSAKAAAANIDPELRPRGGADGTGAGVARGDGWPAIAIGSRALEQDEHEPEVETQAAVIALGEELVRQLDRELGRSVSAD